MKIEIGKKYLTREGKTVEITGPAHEAYLKFSDDWRFNAKVEGDTTTMVHLFTAEGKYWPKAFCCGEEDPMDIVSEVKPARVKIEIGKKYLTREGKTAEVTGRAEDLHMIGAGYSFKATFEGSKSRHQEYVTARGEYWPGFPSERDLVSEVKSAPSLAPITPGKYRTREGKMVEVAWIDTARGSLAVDIFGSHMWYSGGPNPNCKIPGRCNSRCEDLHDLVERIEDAKPALAPITPGKYRTREGKTAMVTSVEAERGNVAFGVIEGVARFWWTRTTENRDVYPGCANHAIPQGKDDLVERIEDAKPAPAPTDDRPAHKGYPPSKPAEPKVRNWRQPFEFEATTKPAGFSYVRWAKQLAELISDEAARKGIPPGAVDALMGMLDGRGIRDLTVKLAALGSADALEDLELRDAGEGPLFFDIDYAGLELRTLAGLIHKEYDDAVDAVFNSKRGVWSTSMTLTVDKDCLKDLQRLFEAGVPEPEPEWQLLVSPKLFDIAGERLHIALMDLGCVGVRADEGVAGVNTQFVGECDNLDEALATIAKVTERALRPRRYEFKATKSKPIDWQRIVDEAPAGFSRIEVKRNETFQVLSIQADGVTIQPDDNPLLRSYAGPLTVEGADRAKRRYVGPVAVEIRFEV